MYTTLNKIREHGPCEDGWITLLKSLNKTKPDDEPVAISYIIESNGLDNAVWCLRAVEGHDKEIRLFSVFCARQVEHLLTDEISSKAIDTAERYANGEATEDELSEAYSAARSAWLSAESAESAAYVAAYSATAPAHLVAQSAWSAAKSATQSAAWSAARLDIRKEQKEELLRICRNTE